MFMEKKPSDYTDIGENYRKYRSGYSEKILDLLIEHIKIKENRGLVVDVGAGTGIWARQMAERGIRCIAIEPNEDMRRNGLEYTKDLSKSILEWKNGSAELTGLSSRIADWVTMASAFHWTDQKKALCEFHRILKGRGYLTLLWNPLIKEGDAIQEKVESIIKFILPEFSRKERTGENSKELLTESGYFEDVIEIRHEYLINMPVERYLGAWRAANHLKTHAKPEEFEEIISRITSLLKGKETIAVPYLTKSWTAIRK